MIGPDSLVSIIMPVLNAAPFLAEAIESVLTQTYRHWELLVVDDGSTDGSRQVADAFAARSAGRIRLLDHAGGSSPRGASVSRNVGLHHATGDYVAFLDADDVWLPENLARQMAWLRAAPEVRVVYSHTLYWHSWAPGLGPSRDYVAPHLVPAGLPIDGVRLLKRCLSGRASVPCTCSMVVRRDLIENVGGFEDGFRQVYTDQAFYSKLFLAGTVLPIEGWWAKYRQHPGSSTRTARRERKTREARERFLTWLEDYCRAIPSASPGLRRTIRRELWRCRHPVGDWLLDRAVIFRRPARGRSGWG